MSSVSQQIRQIDETNSYLQNLQKIIVWYGRWIYLMLDYRPTIVNYRVWREFFNRYLFCLVLDISMSMFQTVAVVASKTEITRRWQRNECQLYVTFMFERCHFFVIFKMSQLTFFRHTKLTFWQSLKRANSSRIRPTRILFLWTILIYMDSQLIVLW
jgi:hypothetical protein